MYGKVGTGLVASGGSLASTGVNTAWLAIAAFTLIGAGFSLVGLTQPAFAGVRQRVRRIFRRG